MSFKFNPFTGTLDIQSNNGSSGGNVTGPTNSTAGDIAIWAGGSAIVDSSVVYATGTFTPSLVFIGAPSTGTVYSIQIGFYVKIGKRVFYDINISLSALGTGGSGNAIITFGSLPYTASNTANYSSCAAILESNLQSLGSAIGIVGLIPQNGTYVNPQINFASTSSLSLSFPNFTDTSSLIISGSFQTDI